MRDGDRVQIPRRPCGGADRFEPSDGHGDVCLVAELHHALPLEGVSSGACKGGDGAGLGAGDEVGVFVGVDDGSPIFDDFD